MTTVIKQVCTDSVAVCPSYLEGHVIHNQAAKKRWRMYVCSVSVCARACVCVTFNLYWLTGIHQKNLLQTPLSTTVCI